MTDFTVKVRADEGTTGSNRIEVILDTRPKTLLSFPGREHGMALEPDREGLLDEDIALYYAVERIAQLEGQLEKGRSETASLQAELTHQRRLNALAMDGNLTLSVVQAKWKGEQDRGAKLEATLNELIDQHRNGIVGVSEQCWQRAEKLLQETTDAVK